MSESLCIDSPLRGLAMPKAYSGDLRERVIEAVEISASRREAAERFEVSVERCPPKAKPSPNGHRDVDFLETMLIGMALEKNKNLLNIKRTALLREMKVPGVINSGQARPTREATDLRNALGLSKK